MHQTYASLEPYITKDGSEIRELMHPGVHGNRNQSLAEARVPAGGKTHLHQHRISEEIYHITQGMGWMILGERRFAIATGDTVCIQPGIPHALENPGPDVLVVICSCSPAYSHADTVLIGD